MRIPRGKTLSGCTSAAPRQGCGRRSGRHALPRAPSPCACLGLLPGRPFACHVTRKVTEGCPSAFAHQPRTWFNAQSRAVSVAAAMFPNTPQRSTETSPVPPARELRETPCLHSSLHHPALTPGPHEPHRSSMALSGPSCFTPPKDTETHRK